MSSQSLFEESLKYVPGGVHSPVRSFKGLHTTPRFISSAKGAYITDEENKSYIDFCMSFGPLILGHQNEKVKTAIYNALERGWTYGACEKYSLHLAKYIVDKIPFIDQIRFVNSGTEAVMTAVRLARGFTGKNKIIKFSGCYHGHLDSMLIKAGSGLANMSEASSKGVPNQTVANTIVCELGNIEDVALKLEEYKDDVAAIFIEPLPANNGLLIQSKEFLQSLRNLANKYDCLLVFDEVISGFRVAFGGMAELTNIEPDLVTYGKIIGGGMPVGAVAGKKNIMSMLAPLGPIYQAGTLSANPMAMDAGLATLSELTPTFYKQVEENTQNIVAIFQEWLSKQDAFSHCHVKSFSSLFWISPTKNEIKSIDEIPSNLENTFFDLFKIFLDKGIYLAPNAYEVGFVSSAHDLSIQKDLKSKLWD